jgi:hypothetical protein
LLKFVVNLQTNSSQILEGVSNKVWSWKFSWNISLEGEGSQIFNTLSEFSEDVIWGETDNFLSQNWAVIVGGDDLHIVEEWLHVHFLKESNFGRTNFLSLCADLVILCNFNLSFLNLCGNL